MIYIPFFIVILISKRGVREAERGGKARTQIRIQSVHTDAKEGCSHRPEKKRYTQRLHHPAKRGIPSSSKKRYAATTTPPPLHTTPAPTPRLHHVHTAYKNAHPRTHAHTRTHTQAPAGRRTGTHGGVQARSG